MGCQWFGLLVKRTSTWTAPQKRSLYAVQTPEVIRLVAKMLGEAVNGVRADNTMPISSVLYSSVQTVQPYLGTHCYTTARSCFGTSGVFADPASCLQVRSYMENKDKLVS